MQYTERQSPESIPHLFAEAWNRRDPDGIAALFDEDAEFVNVTGIWWHDRESIREAHAFGLEHIFSESELQVRKVKVKYLADDIAVVHARITVSGQTPTEDVPNPGLRTTIFSFVVHRDETTGRWSCASAHNTDVVPGQQTNIIDTEGRIQTTDYRR